MHEDPSGAAPRRLPHLPRLPLIAAVLAAFLGVAAVGVAIAAGGPSPAGAAIPLVSTATAAPAAGWSGPGPGGPDWMAPGGPDWMGPRGGRPGGPLVGEITITAINGTQLSLKTADGWTRTIDASEATVTRAGQTVSLSTLQVGDQIIFRETRQSDGTYKIDAINVVLPHVVGTVTAVSASSLTITQPDGASKTVQLTSGTAYRVAGQSASLSAVTTGARVAIAGTVASDGTFTAAVVDVLPVRVAGTVSAKTATTITITDRDGKSVTVDVSSATVYQVAGVTNPTLANVSVGTTIAAQGTRNSDGSLNASVVRVLPAGEPGHGPLGGWGPRGMWGDGPRDGAPVAPGTSSSTSGA